MPVTKVFLLLREGQIQLTFQFLGSCSRGILAGRLGSRFVRGSVAARTC